MALDASVHVAACRVRVLGTIAGFVPDGLRVEEALQDPVACVALGVPPEDLPAIAALAGDEALVAELPEPDEWTARLLELLGTWGATRIPSPDLEAAHAGAVRHGAALEALDLDDLAHTDEHTSRLHLGHIVRMNRRRNRMLQEEFAADDPYELALQWDRAEHASRPLQTIQGRREDHMVARLRALAAVHPSVLAVVPAARFAGVVAGLETKARA